MGGPRISHPSVSETVSNTAVSTKSISADDTVAVVRAEAERDFGALVAPVEAHSAAPRSLAAAWALLRATLVEPGLVDRTTKEAVATAVSLAHSCSYCAELHVTVLEARNCARAEQAAGNDLAALADHRVRQITEWARTAGMYDGPASRRPFGDHHAPELVGTVVVGHYLNRMATVFLPPDAESRDMLAAARPAFERIAALSDRTPGPGTALDLLPAAALPDDIIWAAGRPDLGDAFARAAAAVDAAGARSVPEPVRAVVAARLAVWHGEVPDDGQEWLADLVFALPAVDRPSARLALLTAIAPHEVDEVAVDTFLRDGADQRALVELTAWASFTAARRVGAWLSAGVRSAERGSRVLPFRRRTPTATWSATDAATASGQVTLSP